MATYLTTTEAAQEMGMDREDVRQLCRNGMLRGAFKSPEGEWLIPSGAIGPYLARRPAQPQREGGGDVITVGDMQNSIGAFGRGASVEITQGSDLSSLFKPVYEAVQARPADPDVSKQEIAKTVQSIEAEAQQGEKANPNRLERLLKTLALMAPDILDVSLAALTSPAAGIAAVVRKVAEKAREDAGSGGESPGEQQA